MARRGTYLYEHAENRMASEGNVRAAREHFFTKKPNNLRFLLQQRYEWMNEYLEGKTTVVEIGSGAGFAREFIKNPNLKLTDVSREAWIDEYVDATNLPFAPSSVDALVCSHMIHHVPSPRKFFEAAHRALKPGGAIVICDVYTSTLMRFFLRAMKHEGYSYDVNVFDGEKSIKGGSDPWSANCAVPELLFADPKHFEKEFPGFKVERKELTEGLIFPLSGGVISKTKTIPLPMPVLKAIHGFDGVMSRIFPNLYPMGIRVVLRRV